MTTFASRFLCLYDGTDLMISDLVDLFYDPSVATSNTKKLREAVHG